MPRYLLDGIEVWFGTSDAPAPAGAVTATAPAITVGVAGTEDVAVHVQYRRPGGPWQRLRVRLKQQRGTAQYFAGHFPDLPAGSRIEYEVHVRRGGVQPRPPRRAGTTMSFEIGPGAAATREAEAPLDERRATPPAGADGPSSHEGAAAPTPECQKMLEIVRNRCPGLVPPDPLSPSAVAPQVPVDPKATQELFGVAALHTTGLLDPAGRQTGEAVVWGEHDRELLVEVAKVRVQLGLGVVAVTIPVRCEEVGATAVHVTFAIGDPDRPAGLLAATEQRPRGPRLVVDLWGEALVAFAWTLLLQVAAHVARAAGTDTDGVGLVPAAMTASPDGLGVLPQARHTFDRLIQP